MLEIVDIEEGEGEFPVHAALQQAADAVLDHPPRRQAGQLVKIGGPEQQVLERLLLADIGRA